MKINADKGLMLQGVFAPFDARAWERFREFNPDAAEWLLMAVEAGVTAQEVRQYGKDNDYSEAAVSWLAHAAAWLERQRPPSVTTATATGTDNINNIAPSSLCFQADPRRQRLIDGEPARAGRKQQL